MIERKQHRLALIGGRGYTGRELLRLLLDHPAIELAVASSGAQAGQPIAGEVEGWPDPAQAFVALEPADVAEVDADVWALAVPNGASAPWVGAIEAAHPDAVILDFGADHRFDTDWVYGLTEFNRAALAGARRISNPGCYATGAQFGLLPVRDALAAPPVVFGVSGYSGAGRTPSPRNDPDRLKDNLIPYALAGHVHEREIGAHLGRPVRFHPHVAPFFRGISLTISAVLTEPVTADGLRERFASVYKDEPLVRTAAEVPELRDLRCGTVPPCGLAIGGFTVDERDGHRATWVVVLDNLLKGAAGQALQNLNCALGLPERNGLEDLA
ncbi:N-acetyl-gamma-glutamyl-phosphate reductase [Halomonas denitrificans]|nr:N-acetyl-gamma-glutamyl-phosphate reductase [Halomonas denitrificans]